MTLLVVICLVIMVGSMLMVLNAQNQLENLRQQNLVFKKELLQLQEAHALLLQQLSPPPPTKKEPEEKSPEELASEKKAEAEAEAVSQIQEDMHQLQKTLEKHQLTLGHYPNSIETLNHFAEKEQLTTTRHNPYTGLHSPLFDNNTLLDITHDPADEGLREYAGRILYQAHLDPSGVGVGYTLAAFDEEGMLLKKENEILTLSHAG